MSGSGAKTTIKQISFLNVAMKTRFAYKKAHTELHEEVRGAIQCMGADQPFETD